MKSMFGTRRKMPLQCSVLCLATGCSTYSQLYLLSFCALQAIQHQVEEWYILLKWIWIRHAIYVTRLFSIAELKWYSFLLYEIMSCAWLLTTFDFRQNIVVSFKQQCAMHLPIQYMLSSEETWRDSMRIPVISPPFDSF